MKFLTLISFFICTTLLHAECPGFPVNVPCQISDSANAIFNRKIDTVNSNVINVQTNFKGSHVYFTLDDDLGEDIDGVGSVAVAFRLSDLDEVSVIGTSYVGNHWYGAPDFSALNTFYGAQNVPVGTQRPAGVYTGADYYGTYLAGYPNTIGQGVNDTNGFNTTNAIAMYRRILQASPSHMVTMLFEGQMTNLYGLYNSPADSISPLTGAQLMISKVKQLIILGGTYPSGNEFDFYSDPVSAQVVNQLDGSIPVIFSGYDYGFNVLTKSNQPAYSTVRAAYDKFFQTFGGTNRPSWGAMAVLYAVRGLSYGSDTYATLSAQGTNHVDMAGNNTFTTGGSKNQHYLILAMNPDTMATRIQALMDTLPKATSLVGTLDAFGIHMKTPLRSPAFYSDGNLFAGNTYLTGWLHLNGCTVDGQPAIFCTRGISSSDAGIATTDQSQTHTWYMYQHSATPNLYHLFYTPTASDVAVFNGNDSSLTVNKFTSNISVQSTRVDGDTLVVANQLKLLYPNRGVLYTNGMNGVVTPIDTIGNGKLVAENSSPTFAGATLTDDLIAKGATFSPTATFSGITIQGGTAAGGSQVLIKNSGTGANYGYGTLGSSSSLSANSFYLADDISGLGRLLLTQSGKWSINSNFSNMGYGFGVTGTMGLTDTLTGTYANFSNDVSINGNVKAVTASVGSGSPFTVNTFGDAFMLDATVHGDAVLSGVNGAGTVAPTCLDASNVLHRWTSYPVTTSCP